MGNRFQATIPRAGIPPQLIFRVASWQFPKHHPPGIAMNIKFLLVLLPSLALVSCGSKELSASIAEPVGESGRTRTTAQTPPSPPLPGGPFRWRVPSATDALPPSSESTPGTSSGAGASGSNGSATVTARPPATP